MGSDCFLAAKVPYVKFKIGYVQCLYVEPLCRHDLLNFFVSNGLEDGGFTGIVKAKHTHADFSHDNLLFVGLPFRKNPCEQPDTQFSEHRAKHYYITPLQ